MHANLLGRFLHSVLNPKIRSNAKNEKAKKGDLVGNMGELFAVWVGFALLNFEIIFDKALQFDASLEATRSEDKGRRPRRGREREWGERDKTTLKNKLKRRKDAEGKAKGVRGRRANKDK